MLKELQKQPILCPLSSSKILLLGLSGSISEKIMKWHQRLTIKTIQKDVDTITRSENIVTNVVEEKFGFNSFEKSVDWKGISYVTLRSHLFALFKCDKLKENWMKYYKAFSSAKKPAKILFVNKINFRFFPAASNSWNRSTEWWLMRQQKTIEKQWNERKVNFVNFIFSKKFHNNVEREKVLVHYFLSFVKGYLRVSLIRHKIYANGRKRTEEVQSLSNVQIKQKTEVVENNNFGDFQKSLTNKHSKGFWKMNFKWLKLKGFSNAKEKKLNCNIFFF